MLEPLNPIAEKIISLLVFEETFEQIVSEILEVNEYAIADEIKTLIVKDFVRPVNDVENKRSAKMMYDSDKMKDYSFQLTAKGIQQLEYQLTLKKK
jgi:hypothetical protein